MPEIKNPSKLHKAGTLIVKPIKATVRTTRNYIVRPLETIDGSTEGAVRQAMQAYRCAAA